MKNPKPLYTYIFILFLITLLIRLVLVNYYDFNLGGIEPNVIYGIQRILLGQPLYQDPTAGTYAIMQYTPLWYYTVAGIAKLVSHDSFRHGLDVHGLYALSRVLALVFNLLTVCVCAAIIRAWHFSWLRSIVFALPVFIILTVHYYTRGDSMHLFLFITAVYAYICYSKKGRLYYLLIAALVATACIMVKQNGILVAGIIGLCLLFIERKYFAAILYLVCVFAFSSGIVSLLNNGDWYAFYQNTCLGLMNGIDLSFLYTIFIGHYFLDMVPCYLLGGVMIFIVFKGVADKTYRILVLGMACSWIFAAITGLKIGSSNNYFTEFLLLLLTTLPYLLNNEHGDKTVFRLKTYPVTVRRVVYFAFFVLISSKTMGMVTAYINGSFKNNSEEYANEQLLFEYFKNELHIKMGEHIYFTERRYLDNIFIGYSVMPTKDVVTQVYFANPATFNYSGLVKGMNNGLIKYIVTDQKRDDINVSNDSLPFIFFDKEKFILLAHFAGYSIYTWSPGSVL